MNPVLKEEPEIGCCDGCKTHIYHIFLGLSVLDLGPMYATDVRQHHHLMPPPIRGGGIIMLDAFPVTRPSESSTEGRAGNGLLRWLREDSLL